MKFKIQILEKVHFFEFFADGGRGAFEAAGAAGDGRRDGGRLRGPVDGGRRRGPVAVGGGAARPAAAARCARDDAAQDARVRGTNSGQPRDAQLGRQTLRRQPGHDRQLPAQTHRKGHQQVTLTKIPYYNLLKKMLLTTQFKPN